MPGSADCARMFCIHCISWRVSAASMRPQPKAVFARVRQKAAWSMSRLGMSCIANACKLGQNPLSHCCFCFVSPGTAFCWVQFLPVIVSRILSYAARQRQFRIIANLDVYLVMRHTWLSKGVGKNCVLIGRQLCRVLCALHAACRAPGRMKALTIPRKIDHGCRRRFLTDRAPLRRQHVQVHLQSAT